MHLKYEFGLLRAGEETISCVKNHKLAPTSKDLPRDWQSYNPVELGLDPIWKMQRNATVNNFLRGRN